MPCERLGDVLRVGVGEADRPPPAAGRAPGPPRRPAPPGSLRFAHFGFLELGLGFLRPRVDLRLAAWRRRRGPAPRAPWRAARSRRCGSRRPCSIFCRPLTSRIVSSACSQVTLRRETESLPLTSSPDDDVPAALRAEDAEEVDDVGVLELERDQLGPVRGCRSRRWRGAGVVAAWATTTGAGAAGRTGRRWRATTLGPVVDVAGIATPGFDSAAVGSVALSARGLRRIGRLRRLRHSRQIRQDRGGPLRQRGRSRPSPALRGRR